MKSHPTSKFCSWNESSKEKNYSAWTTALDTMTYQPTSALWSSDVVISDLLRNHVDKTNTSRAAAVQKF
jgi:hypothetical protein